MTKKTEQRTSTTTEEPSRDAEQARNDRVSDAGHVCDVAFCPIGLALSAVQPMKPDVVEHLLAAGREFFLAARALMDARADDLSKEGDASTLEKIDIG
jgi:hypothetical protein